MFDIGFAELLIVAVVALVVLGPDKLPTAVKTLGLWVGRIRRTVTSIQSEISEELRIEEMKRTTAIQKEELEKELSEMSKPFSNVLDEESPMAAKVSSAEELQKQAANTSGPSESAEGEQISNKEKDQGTAEK